MLKEENRARIEEISKKYPDVKAALLPALWVAQEQEGWISEEMMKEIGILLGLPFGHVLGVVTFYTMFNAAPVGKYHIEVCTNASCLLRGSDKILQKVEHVCGAKAGQTSADGRWTVNEVECMGACGGAPMLAIGEDYYENLTPEKTEELLREADMIPTEHYILPDIPNYHRLDIYEAHGGYAALRKALGMKPDEVTDEVKKSNLRGRGGACFPTGLKWTFMPKGTDKPKYLAVNGDESEPGTFKDRQIFEYNPHQLIEGILIGCYAMGITAAYVYIRGEYGKWLRMLQTAVDAAYEKGYIGKNILGSEFSTEIVLHKGAGAYICGEESSLMNSIQGERGYPRIKPPFPAQRGLWDCPTTINNVETMANVPLIINKGWEWYSKVGSPKHPGPILVGISGHVNKPGVYEVPTGVPLLELIHTYAGGIPGDKKIKAVIPGGSSTMILRAEQLEGVCMDADSLKAAGSSVGTAGLIVMDEDTDLIPILSRIAKFYHHESCGQCTPCREGTGWLHKVLERFEHNQAKAEDIDLLLDIANNIEGNTICALGDAAAWPVQSMVRRFREEFEKHLTPASRSLT